VTETASRPALTTLSLPAILQQELERRTAANPRYSLRALALQLGTDHSTLSQIIRGRRALTPDMVERLAGALGLSPLEAAAISAFHNSPAGSPARDAEALLADPLHFELIQLSRSADFQADNKGIAERLGCSPDAVNIAVTRLLRLGLLRMAAPSRWQAAPEVPEHRVAFTHFVFTRLLEPPSPDQE
jgi:transcriptional regulator with XRE-family HTH domain